MTSSEVFFHDSTTCINRLIFFLLLSNVLLLLKFKLPPFFHLHASHIPIFCWTLLTTSLLRHMCGCVFLYHLWAIFTLTLSPSPFLPPKSTHNLWTQLPYSNVVYVLLCILRILLYFCCSPYVIMCPACCCCLCQRSTDFTRFCCYQHYTQPKRQHILESEEYRTS